MLTVERKPANVLSWLNPVMPPTLIDRLHEVMAAKRWDYADLVRESGESRSAVSQWLGRGSKVIKSIGKMEAAERLEAASGYAALWIAKGMGPKLATDRPSPGPTPPTTRVTAAELPPAFAASAKVATLQQALEVLGQHLAMDLPDDVRNDVADALRKLAERRGTERDQLIALHLLSGSYRKQQANGR